MKLPHIKRRTVYQQSITRSSESSKCRSENVADPSILEATEEEIFNKLHRVFLLRGIRWLNTGLIAEHIGFTKTSFRNQYPIKRIVSGLVGQLLRKYRHSLSLILEEEDEPRTKLYRILTIVEDFNKDFDGLFLRDLRLCYPVQWKCLEDWVRNDLRKSIFSFELDVQHESLQHSILNRYIASISWALNYDEGIHRNYRKKIIKINNDRLRGILLKSIAKQN